MPLPTPTRQAQRYLGDAATKVFHDLLHETDACGALDVITKGKGERFIPDRLEAALSVGYKPCPHCLPEYAQAEDEPEDEVADGNAAANKDKAGAEPAAAN